MTEGSELESWYVEEFSLLVDVQTGSESHPASIPMDTAGIKRTGLEADHSPPTSTEVKKTWIYTATPTYAFMA
jgi:hypothetical protein